MTLTDRELMAVAEYGYPSVGKTAYIIKGSHINMAILDDAIFYESGTERSKSMLTRVAIVENVKSEDGKVVTPTILVAAEDVAVKSTTRIRETMLVKYAAKLKGKDLSTIEVVCSDFTVR